MDKNINQALSEATGLSVEEIKKIQTQVKENYFKLEQCSGHKFKDISPDKQIGRMFQCENCGGRVDQVKKHWYEMGIRHAVESFKKINL